MGRKLVTKSAFATMINVSPGRVSQYIASGQISPAAIHGSGQRAKIDVERAKTDLRLTLDVSQRFADGLDTQLEPEAATVITSPATIIPEVDRADRGLDYQIKSAKLEQITRINMNAAIEDAKRRGVLTDTAAAKNEMTKIASSMLEVFGSSINEMAVAIASQYQVPQRDVKHLLRSVFRKVREEAASRLDDAKHALPDILEVTISADEIGEQTIN